MKNKQYRNEKGRFSKIPLGLTAYFSRLENKKPDYYCGKYIVVGRGKNNIVTCIPDTIAVTQLHPKTLKFDQWDVTDVKILTRKELNSRVGKIRRQIKSDTEFKAYHPTATSAAYQLKQIADNGAD